MDQSHSQQDQTLLQPILPSMEEANVHEAFLDEPLQPQDQQEAYNDSIPNNESRRPLHLDTGSYPQNTLPMLPPNNPLPEKEPSLPLVLRLLFGLNGLSLSLLTLPIMYILNTRIAVPLPYLPAYGAIAFLPCSLKPMYAYFCGLWAKYQSSKITPSSNHHNDNSSVTESIPHRINHHQHSYLILFCWLLSSNSVLTIVFAGIPKGGIYAVFVVAFLRGVTDSWAEFCLGLALIDHARASHPGSCYERAVSALQAQAATARNLGSWLASLMTCLVLVGRRLALSSEEPQLTGGLANALMWATAIVQLGGAFSVNAWGTEISSVSDDNGIYEELETEEWNENNANSGEALRLRVSTESDPLRDEDSSHPSYSSMGDLSDDDTDDSSSLSTEGTTSRAPGETNDETPSWSTLTIANWTMVILLQCILVVTALKGPIVEASSHFLWVVVVITLLVGIIVTALALYCKLNNSSHSKALGGDTNTLKVGLFLILKNSIPSDSAILASFFYSLFGANQPLLLQFLSFLGMGVISLSSWSYTRLFSKRFGSGRSLVGLLAATVALESLASLLHVAVFRVYQSSETEESIGASPSRNLLLIAIVSKFATTFFGEWAFLPELVLATTSVRVSTMGSTMIQESTEAIDSLEARNPSDGHILPGLPGEDHVDTNNTNDDSSDDQQRIAMEYGTLVSCIDFGDQLGSLMAAPLVALWQISRDNDFLHLDRLVVFCAVANVAVTIVLLPLLCSASKRKR